jgi:predicted Na+-dependent transporter
VLALVRAAVTPLALLFVLSTMLDLGLAPRPRAILEQLGHRAVVLRMLLVNFVLAPLVMLLFLGLVSLDPALQAGLLPFSLCAGSPFRTELTSRSARR